MMAYPNGVGHPTQAQPLDPPVIRTTTMRSEARSKGKYILNGHYVRDKQVGKGQHGQVYRAIDIERDGTPVAIKVVKRNNPRANRLKELRRQQSTFPPSDHIPLTAKVSSTETKIRKEIAIMKKCRHANVVMLLEVIDDPISERIFMVMEYLGGGELKWKTRDKKPKPILHVDQIRRICRDVILGLEYLHHQGIIHRDIKPANLVWNDDRSTVKITDFGVSHFSYAQRLAATPRSKPGNEADDPILLDDSDLAKRAGTPFYLAPEVVDSDWSGSGDRRPRPAITKAIDIWAFGITLYSLLFGGPPFYEDDPQPHAEFRVYRKICTEDWEVPPTMGFDALPTGGRHPKRKAEGYPVISLLQALLQKDPAKRITLPQLKANRWILTGISFPDQWIRDTAPKDEDTLQITEQDTNSAMAPFAHGTWGRIQRQVSSIFRLVVPGRSNRSREEMDEHDRCVKSLPNVLTPETGSTVTVAGEDKEKNKSAGKGTATNDASSSSTRRRAKSIERPSPLSSKAGHNGRTMSTITPPTGERKKRRGSESLLTASASFYSNPSSPSTPTSSGAGQRALSMDRAPRWLFPAVRRWAGRTWLETATIATTSSPDLEFAAVAVSPVVGWDQAGRHSDETPRSRGPPQTDALTSTKRASSWGAFSAKDDDVESVQSDTVGEIEMRIGAGGYADLPSASAGPGSPSRAFSPDLLRHLVPSSSAVPSVPDPGAQNMRRLTPRLSHHSQLNQVMSSDDDVGVEEDDEDEDGPCSWTEDTDSSGDEIEGPHRAEVDDDDDDDDDGEDEEEEEEDEERRTRSAEGSGEDREGEDNDSAQILMRGKSLRVVAGFTPPGRSSQSPP